MSQPQKIITIVLWIAAVGGMVGLVAMKALPTSSAPASTGVGSELVSQPAAMVQSQQQTGNELPVVAAVPEFALKDQDGKTFTNQQLLGHPWIADFFFTTCSSLCPMMSGRMAALQNQVPADVKLVSFSVDPVNDTPAVLKKYAEKYHAQPGRWIFLTGDEQTQERVVRGMKMGLIPAQGTAPIQHDEHFVLIDAKGRIRGFYDTLAPERMDTLITDAQALASDSGPRRP